LQALQEATDTIKGKQVEAQSKERIADLEQKTKIAIAEINTQSQETQTRVQMEKELWVELHGSAHDFGMAEMQRGHERDMAQRSQTFQSEQAANADQSGEQSQSLGT
jgi:hypothetical protein